MRTVYSKKEYDAYYNQCLCKKCPFVVVRMMRSRAVIEGDMETATGKNGGLLFLPDDLNNRLFAAERTEIEFYKRNGDIKSRAFYSFGKFAHIPVEGLPAAEVLAKKIEDAMIMTLKEMQINMTDLSENTPYTSDYVCQCTDGSVPEDLL